MGWFVANKIALHGGIWNGARTMVDKALDKSLAIAIFLNFNSTKLINKILESTYLLVDKYLKPPTNQPTLRQAFVDRVNVRTLLSFTSSTPSSLFQQKSLLSTDRNKRRLEDALNTS